MRFLLDTHILIYWFAGQNRKLNARQRKIIDTVSVRDEPFYLADISLWEVANLYDMGRISFDRPLMEWLTAASAPPQVMRQSITPAIAAEVAALPSSFHRDPADRLIVATARVLGAKLLTSDERIIQSGLVETI